MFRYCSFSYLSADSGQMYQSSLSRSLQKFTNVFCEQGLARGGELVKELGKVPAGELPFEGPSCGFPIVLKV